MTGMIRLKNIKNRLGAQGQSFMVPIYPDRFRVGTEDMKIQTISVEQFEKLSTAPELDALLSSFGATEL